MTDSIQSLTGTESEVGKQFNRLTVSTLRLAGHLQELQNKATETVYEYIKDYTSDSVDQVLATNVKLNREGALALKNAETLVTNNDRAEELYLAKEGIKRPVVEDLHRKLMYFPEALPNATDSAIKGDFKDDDRSYSDTVGKIVGGLNPVGDIRDIVANGRKVILGKDGAGIGLGAAIFGTIPLIGDGGKIIFRVEKEVITETIQKFLKQGVEERAEKLAREEVARLTKDAEAQIVKENEVLTADGKKLIKFEYKEVEIIDKQGTSLGEFDKIEKGLFIEEKSAIGLNTLHPKTGKPVQTPESWARKQIYEKICNRIENLQNSAAATRTTVNGTKDISSLDEIKEIKRLEFRIDGDTPDLRKAVEDELENL